MIVLMKNDAILKQISTVIKKVEELGFKPHFSKGKEKTLIGVVGNERKVDPRLDG